MVHIKNLFKKESNFTIFIDLSYTDAISYSSHSPLKKAHS